MIPKRTRTTQIGFRTIEEWSVPNLKGPDCESDSEDEHVDCDGVWDPKKYQVLYDDSLSPFDAFAARLHERLHAISDHYALGLDERTIRCIESGLLQSWEDKP
jgi:hypothetical protein